MRKVIIKRINAFSINGKGGNPAGVVLDADALSNREKQQIAAVAKLSEIAFVSRSDKADFKLEFFTPTRQIAHCGHATIATFTYLKQQGLIKSNHSSKETIDGNREIYFKNGFAFMEQKAPAYTSTDNDLMEILGSMNLSKSDLLENHLPEIVNTGNSFLLIPIANKEKLKSIQPDFEKISNYSERHGLIGFYPFCITNEEDAVATTRMFAPFYGIEEEAATGMAAGPLACYLFDRHLTQHTEMVIRQGEFMHTPSPSNIYVSLHLQGENIARLYAGGDAVVADEITILL
jgi:PhzF family phenazine biosynthesis protein